MYSFLKRYNFPEGLPKPFPSGGTRPASSRPEEYQLLSDVPRPVMAELIKRFGDATKKLQEEIDTAPISTSATPLQSHPITLPPLQQPNQYGNPYDANYVPAKDRGPPGPTKPLPKVPELTKEKIDAAIVALEAQESGEKVKDEKSFGRKLKRGQKVFHKQGDPNCECFHCVTTMAAKPVDVKKKNELDNLVYAMLKGLNKRGFEVSRKYAEKFLGQHDNNLVHSMAAAVDDLKKREAAIQLSGRLDLTREIECARHMGITFLDEILNTIAGDDKHMLEFEELGWNSSYGRAIIKHRVIDRDQYFALYNIEAAYRKARAQFFAQHKDELDAGKLTVQEFKHAMAEFDNTHGYGKDHEHKVRRNRVIRGLGKSKDSSTAVEENSDEGRVDDQDTTVDSPKPASEVGEDQDDTQELPVTQESRDTKKTKGKKKAAWKEYNWKESKLRVLVKPQTEDDLRKVAMLVMESGHNDLVYSLMQIDGDEAFRHQRFLMLHAKVAGTCYDGEEVDEYSINHLMKLCPYIENRERAILEIQVATGSAALAVAFSQSREAELDKMHIEKYGKETAKKIERPAYSLAEAMRFVMAVLYQILPTP